MQSATLGKLKGKTSLVVHNHFSSHPLLQASEKSKSSKGEEEEEEKSAPLVKMLSTRRRRGFPPMISRLGRV